ncbi:MAG: membrane-bound lytic murein transglycosylase MltF [Burkholderiales bacterium]
MLGSCGSSEWHAPPFGSTHELIIATVNGPTTFFEDSQGNFAGFEHDLASLFAQKLGMNAKFVVYANRELLMQALARGKAHLAAAGLAVSPDGEESGLISGPAYFKVQPQLAYNQSEPKPKSLAELSGKRIGYISDPGLNALLKAQKATYPGVDFSEVKKDSSDELLSSVSDGTTDYAIAYSNQIDIAEHYYPNIDTAFDIGPAVSLAWAFPENADPELLQKARDFFAGIEKDGTLARVIDRYYGHIYRLEQADIVGFLGKMDSRLDTLRPYFEDAEEVTGIDWRLLAALAYQESHWDAHATSPTGVRGIMMLTGDTADRLNVSDRLDPRQSIVAGARYLAMLKDEIPAEVKEPDRTWFALAAYNVGTAHLEDAMQLAKRLKKNPDSWVDLKDVLPLLSRPGYFGTVQHGFARGGEAVIMVGSIRNYYDLLTKYKPPHVPVFKTNF